jgi:histone H3/H4
VIASRLKDYIRQRYGMNTSDGVLEDLSEHLRTLCDRAVLHAREDGRKTVLDRDFAFLSERK